MQTGSDTSTGGAPEPERPAPARWSRVAGHALTTLRIFLRSIEVFLWAAFFALALFFLGLRYWLLPNVERFRDEIVATVSASIGLPVTIEGIGADWRGLRPQLELVNVRVFDQQGREALLLPSVTNVVSWRSALFLNLRLHSFAVEDLKVSVRRDAAGGITIAGIPLSEERGDGSLADWVLAQKQILVRNAEIEWIDETRGAPPLRLTDLDFRLTNDDDEHAIGLSAKPPRELGSSIDLRAELVGKSVKELRAWNGRVYAELGNTDLSAWRAWVDYPVDVRSGQGALRMWVTLVEGRLRRAVADVSLSGVTARLGKDLPMLELSGLQGRLSGRYTSKGYELGTRALRFESGRGVDLLPTTMRLAIEYPAGGALMTGAFSADRVDFAPLAHVVESLPFTPELRLRLAELAPRGGLLEARFDWRGEPAQPTTYTARTRFADLAMKPWGRIPGFSGLTGSLDASEKKGTLYLAAQKAVLDLPKVFTEPRIALDALSGQVGWEVGAAAGGLPLQFNLSNLSFANAHVAGTAYGRYTWTGEGPGVIDLSAQLARADARQIGKYMPLAIGPLTRGWLDRAVIAGTGSDVRLRLRGDLRDFPYLDASKGQFQVAAKVSNGQLDYVEGWPRLEGIEADLLFERDRMEVVGRKGRILGAAVSGVRVSLPGLGTSAPRLKISGTVDGPSADFLRYIQQSPVRRMIDGATDGMQAAGRGQLRLNLDLPLEDLERSRVEGSYQFSANGLSVDSRLPQIERAGGRVEFTENSLNVRDVRGSLFGGTVNVSGGTRPEGGILISARGDATVAGMRGFFDHPWKRYLSGASSYTASLQSRNRSTRIVFESNLRGVTSEMPAPLAKPAQEALPLRVEIVPDETGDRISLAIGSVAVTAAGTATGTVAGAATGSAAATPAGGVATAPAAPRNLSAEFVRRREGDAIVVLRTGVGLNQPARLPERNGLLLAGALPALSLDAWMPLIASADAVPSPAPASGTPQTSTFDLRLGAMDVYGRRLSNVALRAGSDARGWQASMTASEIAGDIGYRNEGRGRLTARLSYFTPPPEAPGPQLTTAGKANEYPAVDLVAERFSYRGKQLGRVEVVAQPEGVNWRIERLANLNPEAVLTGKGLWTLGTIAPPIPGTAPGGAARTALEFSLDVNDIGKYLDRIGYPETVKAGTARLSGRLAWNGDPLNIDYPSLGGDLSMQAEGGQFLEIEPGIGKLVSLMSMQMLPRRIALDFRDVFSKGFAFDRITSSMRIEKGVMSTRDFKMRGPAAEVDVSGETDLSRERQTLHVRVVPQLGDTASTVVGLLNPIAGVATMIAQRILKNPLGQIFAFDYAVTGTWIDPKVEKVAAVPVQPAAPAEPAPAPR
jgi:uncharacterized protein YhdP